jgi:uncharacterized protein (DUF58 family)
MSSTYAEALAAGERAAQRYLLTVPRTLTAGLGGVRLGRRAGSSLEFQEYRDYHPGDDPRHLDWSAYGRSDRLVVKLFREEVDPHVDLLVDGSRSMASDEPVTADAAAGPAPSVKAAAAAGLAALLAAAAARGGFSQSAWLLAAPCRALGPANARPRTWDGLSFDFRAAPRAAFASALARSPPPWRRRGVRVLLSDLLWDEEPRSILARLARGAAAVVVVQVLSADDAAPAPHGFVTLVDAESGETHDLLVDAAAVERYAAALAEHQRAWREACREIGAVMATVTAERLVDGWPPEELAELVELQVLEPR